jgi:hypothetical protein
MRVLVCGGRDYQNDVLIYSVLNMLDRLNPITTLIHGDARGADTYAGKWADAHKVPTIVERAEWDKYQNAAGPIRNRKMLTHKPDLVIAFPGGRGTQNMINQAKAAGVAVRQYFDNGED